MDHLDDALKTKGIEIQEADIEWVLTVPAIWNDPAKQFMRQAAEMVFKIKPMLTIIWIIQINAWPAFDLFLKSTIK